MEEKLVTLAKFRFAYRAHLLKDLLNNNSIDCWVSNKSVLGQIDGVLVMIDSKDVEKAKEIYLEFEKSVNDIKETEE